MPLPNKLSEVLDENNGFITTQDANNIGISNERLCLLVKNCELERVAFGIYSLPYEILDKMYILQKQKPKIIFSHETALFLHDLTDRDPLNYSITVPKGHNNKNFKKEFGSIYTVKPEHYEVGITNCETMFGNTVKTYNLERTICDCLRSRNKMDIDIVTEAVKRYVKRKDKDINLLMETAEKFRVTKQIRNYMEVLL